MITTDLINKAIVFASDAHKNVFRKGSKIPYITHCMEAMTIAATITEDQEILAAAILHDVIEDTEYSYDDVKNEFGERVAKLVLAETQEEVKDLPKTEAWHKKRENAINSLKNASKDAKIVAIGDKLSNMRAIERDYKTNGDDFWNRFSVTDPIEQKWYYTGLTDALAEISETEAYIEFKERVNRVFSF